ncbi:MAG: aspartate aminotransferase family protein [Betaproteobacteria bacterium]|nr:aspartate aminotransferase family protein [Betaproteobacteria bacterium]MDH5222962.1 aspartate aminotransferase family protein [Betaproteobacteria bacterium]MDH5351044.1 aspartate aminotransferase family protein [Betaproteobacteria bacterium]
MTRVFHRNPRSVYPVAVRGEGAYLIDREGKRYLDASGGAAVSCLGHSDEAVVRAIREQLARLPFAHTSFFSNEPMEALADALVARAPAPLEKVYFVSGGSEAVEAALKLARQYFVEKGEPQRRHVIGRRQSYHGNTLGALAVGGNQWRRRQFEPLLIEATHVSPCYAYRDRLAGESDDAYGARLAAELESEIRRLGEDCVIAFIAETVAGATLGAVPPVPGYFKRVREVCDRYGVLLILDEVMCGMGRCGSLWTFAQEGIVPDLAVIAKGLGAGYQPIGAVMVSGRIFEAVVSGTGYFQHGHTYLGHAAACAGALAVQRRLHDDGLLARVAPLGTALESRLRSAFDAHPHVGDIRGRGLFWGLELVADRERKTPFDPRARIHARVKAEALKAGLLCYPMGGTIDGERGDHVLLAPPFILEERQLDELVSRLGQALDAVLRSAVAA